MVRTFAKKLRDKNERRGLRASKCFEIVTTQRQNTPTEEEVQTVIDILNDVLKEQADPLELSKIFYQCLGLVQADVEGYRQTFKTRFGTFTSFLGKILSPLWQRQYDKKPKEVCRFGSDCHRSDCKWAHACKLCTGAEDASEERKSKACKHGIACWNSCCQFAHPSPTLTCNTTTYFWTVKSFASLLKKIPQVTLCESGSESEQLSQVCLKSAPKSSSSLPQLPSIPRVDLRHELLVRKHARDEQAVASSPQSLSPLSSPPVPSSKRVKRTGAAGCGKVGAHEPKVCAEVDKLVSLTAEETELRTRMKQPLQGQREKVVAPVASDSSAVVVPAEQPRHEELLAGVAQGESGQVVAAVASTPSAVVVAAEPAKGSEIIMQEEMDVQMCQTEDLKTHESGELNGRGLPVADKILKENCVDGQTLISPDAPDAEYVVPAKPFEKWDVKEVCGLVKSIGFAEAADVIEAIKQNCVDDGGLGLKPMQKMRFKTEIEQRRSDLAKNYTSTAALSIARLNLSPSNGSSRAALTAASTAALGSAAAPEEAPDSSLRPVTMEVMRELIPELEELRRGTEALVAERAVGPLVEAEAAEKECCICLKAEEEVGKLLALVPCGHRCVCADCSELVVGHTCPVCRTEARQAIRVFD